MNEFSIDIRHVDDEWHISCYDLEGDYVVQAVGENVGDCIHHAIYEVNPVIAASCWPNDYVDWTNTHIVNGEDHPRDTTDEGW